MLKRILVILGVLFVLVLLLCGGLVYWAKSVGTARQEQFFAAVNSGKAADVLPLMHPALVAEIDEPVLQAWMNEFNQRLGKFQGLSVLDFHTEARQEKNLTLLESSGTVNFEKGKAESNLTFHDDKIVRFQVNSDEMPKEWFKGPADSGLYRQRGEEFLRFALDGQPEKAFAMMHAALQDKMPLETLRSGVGKAMAEGGKLKAVTFEREEFEGGEGKESLKLFYKIQMEKAVLSGSVVFRFIGLKGHLVAFDIKPAEK